MRSIPTCSGFAVRRFWVWPQPPRGRGGGVSPHKAGGEGAIKKAPGGAFCVLDGVFSGGEEGI